MKIVAADNDFRLVLGDAFDLVAPLSDGLDRGLDGFGPGVHGQDFVGIGEVAEFFVKRTELVVAESAGGEGEFFGLFDHGIHDAWVAVPLVDGGIGGQAVHVFFAVNVPDPDAVTAFNDDIEGFVVVCSEFIFKQDVLIGTHVFSPFAAGMWAWNLRT